MTVAGSIYTGDEDGTGGLKGRLISIPRRASFWTPRETLYIADNGNQRIRVLDAAGNVTTLVGNGMPGEFPTLARDVRTVGISLPRMPDALVLSSK